MLLLDFLKIWKDVVTMEINDLKAGYLVITNDNSFYLVTEINIGLVLHNSYDTITLNLYTQDFVHKREKEKNIRAVYGFADVDGLKDLYSPKNRKLLFSRVGAGFGIHLSTYEYGVLSGLHVTHKYIARDFDDMLYVFSQKPYYVRGELRFSVGGRCLSLPAFNDTYFKDITYKSGIHPIEVILNNNQHVLEEVPVPSLTTGELDLGINKGKWDVTLKSTQTVTNKKERPNPPNVQKVKF